MATKSRGMTRYIIKKFTSPLFYARGKAFKSVSKRLGFVYFGMVNQHEDDHDVIRGFSASTSHKDSHYSVGAFSDYDVQLVDRYDALPTANGKIIEHNWSIVQLTLKSSQALPHVFLQPLQAHTDSYSRFFAIFNQLQKVSSLFAASRPADFTQRYAVFASTAHIQAIDDLLSQKVVQLISTQFWPLGIEISHGKLLVYTAENRPSKAALESMISSAISLAEIIDEQQ